MSPTPVDRPVATRGRMVRGDGDRYATYQPENHAHRDQLCDIEIVSSWRNPATGEVRTVTQFVGKDPMTIPLDVLTAAGHPQAAVRSVILRLRVMHGVDIGEARHDGFLGLRPQHLPKRLTQVRDTVCAACCDGNKAEIRRCAIYDCAAWAFRMGRNPHNPRRGHNKGINPFALSRRSVELVSSTLQAASSEPGAAR